MNRVLGTEIQRSTFGWRSTSLRVYVVQVNGLPFDGRLSPIPVTFTPETLSLVTIPLEGEYVSFRGGVAIPASAGTALVESTTAWDERWERDLRALVVQWSATFGEPQTGSLRLGPADLEHARALADRICAPSDEEPLQELLAFLRRLRALGIAIELPAPEDLPEVPSEVVRIERVMSDLFTALERAPSAVDLSTQTGLSERHLRRLFEQHRAWLGGFRKRLQVGRLPSAANWLAQGLPTERVARSLGYGSARALVRALDDAGWHAPVAVRRRAL